MITGPVPGYLFGGVFGLAGVFFILLPVIAPERQGDTPIWFNILGGALFVIVGFAVTQMQRNPKSLHFWAGLMCTAIGGFIMIMAGFDPDDSRFHAPRWVAAAAGATFLLAGVAVIKSGRSSSDGTPRENSLGYGFILALLLTCFGAVASWVAFGPGEREFQGEVSLGTGLLPFDVGDLVGRIVFSPGALLLDFMALAAWFYLCRALVRRLREKPHK